MSSWVAKLKDGSVVKEGEIDWSDLDKNTVKVLYLVVGDQTLSLPGIGYFFQYKASVMNLGTTGFSKSKLYQTIGTTFNSKGDCLVIVATDDGDVLVGMDNVHNMRTFDDIGHINFELHGIGLSCEH